MLEKSQDGKIRILEVTIHLGATGLAIISVSIIVIISASTLSVVTRGVVP